MVVNRYTLDLSVKINSCHRHSASCFICISFSDQISFERIDGSNWTRRSNYTSSYRCVDKREVCFCELFL